MLKGSGGLTRRGLLTVAAAATSATLVPPSGASADDGASADTGESASAAQDAVALVKRLTGKTPTESERVRLIMPRQFSTGYTVPLSLEVDSPMTGADHVRHVRVLAPRNPIVEVVDFHFVAERSEPRIATRIRLAEPQYVVALAEMSDGALLMAKTWVAVATNGCN